MITRGIPDKPGLAFVISRSIAKKGIKPQPFLRDTKVEIKSLTPSIKEALEKDLKTFTKEKIEGKIKEQIKNK